MKVVAELQGKYRDLVASNMPTTLRVLKFCCEPGGICDKRNGRSSLTEQEKFEEQNPLQSPKNH